jgi:hypothetical protein
LELGSLCISNGSCIFSGGDVYGAIDGSIKWLRWFRNPRLFQLTVKFNTLIPHARWLFVLSRIPRQLVRWPFRVSTFNSIVEARSKICRPVALYKRAHAPSVT